jgi:hypothetical protein
MGTNVTEEPIASIFRYFLFLCNLFNDTVNTLGRRLMTIYLLTVFFKPFFNLCGGTLVTAATTDLLYQPRMIGDGDCGETGGMKIVRGNRSTRRKPATAPLCPPQIPHD